MFTARAGLAGKVIADLNFELPAHAHGTKDGVRCTYEYVDFLEEFILTSVNTWTARPIRRGGSGVSHPDLVG